MGGSQAFRPSVMKKLAPILLALTLCGCAHSYVIKMSNGTQVLTASKPKLKGACYHYKDAKGRDIAIPVGKVTEIEPKATAEEDSKTFKPATQSKPKHWYFLWLA